MYLAKQNAKKQPILGAERKGEKWLGLADWQNGSKAIQRLCPSLFHGDPTMRLPDVRGLRRGVIECELAGLVSLIVE